MSQKDEHKQKLPKPPWLKRRIPSGATYQEIRGLIQKTHLHTVCQEACCPNLGECFSQGTATFLILGDRCTRDCRFCAVAHGSTEPPDPEEPLRVAEAVEQMKLRYAVVTSVTRDDLKDGGAFVFAETIRKIREKTPETRVEVLIPDFRGDLNSLKTVMEARPDVLNHNVETVPRLYASVRPQAVYQRSIDLLRNAHRLDPSIPTKSGLMLGLGEQPEEVVQVLRDLLDAGCRILTLGQYLQPSAEHLPVERFVTPEEFEGWRKKALEMGFREVASGPFVRSSYHANEAYQALSSTHDSTAVR
jgi:lipoic acid synthetase